MAAAAISSRWPLRVGSCCAGAMTWAWRSHPTCWNSWSRPDLPPSPSGRSRRSPATGFRLNNPADLMAEVVGHITRAWEEWATALTELADGVDLLVTGKVEQGLAANVAEYYGIPLATLQYFPAGDSPLGGFLGHVTQDAQDAQHRALGLPQGTGPSTRSTLEIQAYDEVCFPGLAAEWSQQSGISRLRPFVGALTLELPGDADDEVLSWIAAGTPPIYFGFGSMPIPSPVETVAVISAACAQLGERALMCSGPNDFGYVPHFDNVKSDLHGEPFGRLSRLSRGRPPRGLWHDGRGHAGCHPHADPLAPSGRPADLGGRRY